MSERQTIRVFFRGRHTDQIATDAERLLGHADQTIIVRRNDDTLAGLNDVTVSKFFQIIGTFPMAETESEDQPPEWVSHVQVVANGGTTDQQVPVIAQLVKEQVRHATNAFGYDMVAIREYDLSIVRVDQDKVELLYGQEINQRKGDANDL